MTRPGIELRSPGPLASIQLNILVGVLGFTGYFGVSGENIRCGLPLVSFPSTVLRTLAN